MMELEMPLTLVEVAIKSGDDQLLRKSTTTPERDRVAANSGQNNNVDVTKVEL